MNEEFTGENDNWGSRIASSLVVVVVVRVIIITVVVCISKILEKSAGLSV